MPIDPTCSVSGCERKRDSRTYCSMHYHRWLRHGDPAVLRPARPRISPTDRFWSKVQKTDGCWLWTGAVSDAGYGSMGIDGATVLVHRLSFELAFGPIPRGMFICHHCDTPACVRPDHLFVGTPSDNAWDMVRKGRWGNKRFYGEDHWARRNPERVTRGSRQAAAKLTEADIPVVRQRRQTGETLKTIATDYGVSEQCISSIMRGVSWTHVP